MPKQASPALPYDRWRAALRRERKRARLSQAALAVLIGSQGATVCDWERGAQVPTLGSVDRVRDALSDVPPLEGAIERDWVTAQPRRARLRRPEEIADRPAWARRLVISRLEAGLSQVALSRLTGIDVSVICQYETGRRRPGVLNERRMTDALAGVVP